MITGPGLHQALLSVIPEPDSEQKWEGLDEDIQRTLVSLAAVIHQQEVQPLQALLDECMTMLNGALSPCVDHAETHAWCARRDDLDVRVKAALGGEEP